MAELSAGVARVLSQVRRGSGDGQARRGFTVARTEALLRLREVLRAPWGWTLDLLRAARALSTSGRAIVEETQEGEERVVTLRFGVGGVDLAGADLRGILYAAVAGEEDMSSGPAPWLGEVGAKWRAYVGAAINAGLAAGPRSIEVRTASDARVYVRKDSHAVGGDPYGEHAAVGRCPAQAFEVVIREARPGFGRRVAAWLARQASAAAQVEKLWRESLFLPADQRGAIEVGKALPGYEVVLGRFALWGADWALGGPWLVRDGVRSVSLARALSDAGLPVDELGGWIVCPELRLTADEATVTHDAAWEQLVAWLHDARAHTVQDVAIVAAAADGAAATTAVMSGRDGKVSQVQWPQKVDRVALASGRVIEFDEVAKRIRSGRDFLYAWTHQKHEVPATLQARAHVLWPSELAVLQAKIPELRAVPLRALGDTPQVERADLSALHRSSLQAVSVPVGGAPLVAKSGAQVSVQVQAYVHRYPTDKTGAIALMSYGRRVAQVRESAQVIPGVTLVCELAGVDMDALRADNELLRAVVERCGRATAEAMARLLAQAMAHTSPWEVPLVRLQVAQLSGSELGVRFRVEEDRGPVLTWDDSPLLGLAVGRDETHTTAVTLQQVLVRVRDVGGVIVENQGQAWPGWASTRPEHVPWTLTADGRALVERVVGKEVLWDLPTMPEMHALPGTASVQSQLVLAPGELTRLRTADEPRVHATLRAHVLASRAQGLEVGGLMELPLFVRFDPRALQSVKLVSLQQVLSEGTGVGLVPWGAASRRLTGPALLVTPGEAALLYGHGLRPAIAGAAVQTAGGVSAPSHARPMRRSETSRVALLVVPVASPVAVGSLRLDGTEPTKVALWGGGLHIDDLELPAPLQCVGGRLILTKQGTRAGSDRLAGEIRGMCRQVVVQAIHQRRLHVPGGSQRAGLDEFLKRVGEGEGSAAYAELLAPRGGELLRLGAMLALSIKEHPLHKLPAAPRRFESALRQSLARPLAVGSALLSWQAARLVKAADTGSGWEVELGRRSAAVQRATSAEARDEDVYVATALALAGLFADARAAGTRQSSLLDEWVAVYRLLALVYAHVP